jgi:DNA polymerase-3 subunit gamma/tau
VLAAHFRNIADAEKVDIEDDALSVVAKAADGSVRDGLSFLDQLIANADGRITADAARRILGLAGNGPVLDLYESVMGGDMERAIGIISAAYRAGTDSMSVLSGLMEMTHYITRVKVSASALATLPLSAAEQERISGFAGRLSIAVLARAWSMLLKGFEEISVAPDQLAALEMLAVRLSYAGMLPTPAEAIANSDGVKKN